MASTKPGNLEAHDRAALNSIRTHREVTSVVAPLDNSHSNLQQPCKNRAEWKKSLFPVGFVFLQGFFFLAGGSEQVPW
jgi:hypothetical protein